MEGFAFCKGLALFGCQIEIPSGKWGSVSHFAAVDFHKYSIIHFIYFICLKLVETMFCVLRGARGHFFNLLIAKWKAQPRPAHF